MASKWATTLLAAIGLISTADADAGDEWRAYINSSCVVADEPFLIPESDDDAADRSALFFGAIATKLAGALMSVAVDGAVGGHQAGARKESKFVTAEDFNLYLADLSESPAAVVTPRMGCFTVVAGAFADDSVDCTGNYVPREVSPESLQQPPSAWQTLRTDNSVENVLRRANICMMGKTKSVHEARILFSEDRTAYRMHGAGYWINSLSSTRSSRAKRNLLYTLEIVEPSEGNVDRVLSTAWINIGQVSAGDSAVNSSAASRSDWLRVPAMSSSARRAHKLDTSVHQDVIGHIDALERAVVRDARLLDGIRVRAESAGTDVRAALDSEMARIRVRIVTSGAMLDARLAEYDDLPRPTLRYMPVTMRFGITESRSEKRSMRMLAAMLEMNKELLTQTASDMVVFGRSLDLDSSEVDLDSLRQTYFDALVAVETGSTESGDDFEEIQQRLAVAKQSYDAARVTDGLGPVQ